MQATQSQLGADMARRLSFGHAREFNKQKQWLFGHWKTHLSGQSVEWPANSPTRIAQLVGLSFFIGEAVEKDSLGKFVQTVIPGASSDQQARHLRSIGWDVVGSGRGENETNHLPDGTRMPKGTYCLRSVTNPSPIFARSTRLKRQGRAGARDWKDVCEYYNYKCAHCGKECRNPDKGHMDPNGPAKIENLIPLCSSCNNWAASDVVFGKDGRIKAVLSKRFLEHADEDSLARIRAWLEK